MIRPHEIDLSFFKTSRGAYTFEDTATDLYLDDASLKSFSYIAGIEVKRFLCTLQTSQIIFSSQVSLEVLHVARNGI